MLEQFTSLSASLQIAAAFAWGLAASLSPCVYPMIPITVAIFGCHALPRAKAFVLSLFFVGGMALSYTAAGMAAAASGALFGVLLGRPIVIVPLSLLLVLLALYTLELVRIPWLTRLQARAGEVEHEGRGGVFIAGALCGVVNAPCMAPSLAVILSAAAATRSPAWSALLLFVYALGTGVLFLVIGTFSSAVAALPKAGRWMLYVRYLIAAALLIVILFILRPIFDLSAFAARLSHERAALAAVMLSALAAGWFASRAGKRLAELGLAAVLASAVFLFALPGNQPAHPSAQTGPIAWESDLNSALTHARNSGRFLMLDFYADWCIGCRELDATTFSDSRVAAAIERSMVPVRIDLTHPDETHGRLTQRYRLIGVPTVLFLDAGGAEIPGSRITGIVGPEKFLARLERVNDTRTP